MIKRLFTRSPSPSAASGGNEPSMCPPQTRRTRPPAWFDSSVLDATFDELQSAVKETTLLASNISSQLERKLHVTELQFSVMIDIIADAVVIVDSDLNVLEWNRGSQQVFGYTKEEAIGRPLSFLDFYGADPDCFACSIPHLANRAIREFRAAHKSGRAVDVELTVSPFPSTVPGRQLCALVMRDVTARKADQASNETHRKLMDTIINSTSDVIVARDAAGRWILANNAAKHLYTFVSDADYMMKTSSEIAAELPEFKEPLAQVVNTDEEAWAHRRPIRFEQTFTDQTSDDCNKQYFDVIKAPIFDQNGERDMIVVTARNVTAVKEKRKHMSIAYKALNASSDAVCVTNGHGNIVFANKMFLIKYGFIELSAALGVNISTIEANADQPAAADKWETLHRGMVWSGHERCKDVHGVEFDVATTVSPIVDDQLDTNCYIWVQRTI